MKIWLLTFLILALLAGGVDLVQNYPTPMDDRPYLYRSLLVLIVSAFLSLPTALAVALVGHGR